MCVHHAAALSELSVRPTLPLLLPHKYLDDKRRTAIMSFPRNGRLSSLFSQYSWQRAFNLCLRSSVHCAPRKARRHHAVIGSFQASALDCGLSLRSQPGSLQST